MVCAIWTAAFVIKRTVSFMGLDVMSTDPTSSTTKAEDDFRDAVILALYSIVTELIPLYVVIDPRFVKIFTMNFLLTNVQASEETEETELN